MGVRDALLNAKISSAEYSLAQIRISHAGLGQISIVRGPAAFGVLRGSAVSYVGGPAFRLCGR